MTHRSITASPTLYSTGSDSPVRTHQTSHAEGELAGDGGRPAGRDFEWQDLEAGTEAEGAVSRRVAPLHGLAGGN